MSRYALRVLLTVVAAGTIEAVGSSCGDPTAVERMVGRFELATVDGQGPPFVFTSVDTTPYHIVTDTTTYADVIRVYANSTFVRVWQLRYTRWSGGEPSGFTQSQRDSARFYLSADGSVMAVVHQPLEGHDTTSVFTMQDDATIVRCGWVGEPCATALDKRVFILKRR